MRLIDADALPKYTGYALSADEVATAVDTAPTIDAVPVVRCKDCVYYQDNNDGYPHDGCRWRSDETPDADDFCSFAERKDND